MSRLGDETRYHESPATRSNVWPGSVYHDTLSEFPRSGSSESSTSTNTRPGSAAGALPEALPTLFISAQTSLASDLDDMPDLELDTFDYGGHQAISGEGYWRQEPGPADRTPSGSVHSRSAASLTYDPAGLANLGRDPFAGSGHLDISSSSGHLDISSSSGHLDISSSSSSGHLNLSSSSGHLNLSSSGHLNLSSSGHLNLSSSGHLAISTSMSSGGVTPALPAPETYSPVEEAYRAAELSINAAYYEHGKFWSRYSAAKAAMSTAGNVDASRLGSLLARQEEAVRSSYGRNKWQSYNMDYGVDSYTSSVIQGTRDRTLSRIKREQRSMGLPSKLSSVDRLKSWAGKTFSKKGGRSTVPRHLMDAIAEDDEAA